MKIITCSSIISMLTNKTKVKINKTTLLVSIITTAHLINQIKTTMKHSAHNKDLTPDSLNRQIVDRITDRGTFTLQPLLPLWGAKYNQDSASEQIINLTIVIKNK